MIPSGNISRVHMFELMLRGHHLGHSLQIEVSRNVYVRICLCDSSTLSSGGITVCHLVLPHRQEVDYRLQTAKTPSDSGSHTYRG